MSFIFDNSTLSAVQRLTGTAPAPHWYDAQGDYAALENFVCSLIFNDDFYFVDDYKPEYRDQRRVQFPYCRPISREAFPYDELAAGSEQLTHDIVLDIRGGRLQPGLTKEFLESIGLYLTCAWHMRSSDYYLVLKILADGGDEIRNKYSPLTALIFSQLRGQEDDKTIDAQCLLVDSTGKEINDGIDHDLKQFARSLNWLSLRSAFYTLVGAHFDTSVCLHPIRHNFVARWGTEKGVLENAFAWRAKLISYFSDRASATINEINQAAEPAIVGLNLPLFAAWAVGSAGNVTDGVSFALDVRLKPEAVNVRRYVGELDDLRCDRDVAKFKKALNR